MLKLNWATLIYKSPNFQGTQMLKKIAINMLLLVVICVCGIFLLAFLLGILEAVIETG